MKHHWHRMTYMPVPSWDSRIPVAVVFKWNGDEVMFGFRKRSAAWVWRRKTKLFRRLPCLSIGLEHIFLFSNRDYLDPYRKHIHLEL